MEEIFPYYGYFSASNIIIAFSSLFMIFGGVIPYVPQYNEIKKTENAEGFSLYVCLALLVANTLRILFWFGHPFELPLLLQSIIMNTTMLVMVHLCVKVRRGNLIVPGKSYYFTDLDKRHFWAWTDFWSYLEFVLVFTLFSGLVMYSLLDVALAVEAVGFAALLTESCIGLPQLYRNFSLKSTSGMSKKMVLLWTLGDLYKTTYFILREAPLQFWVCGCLQVSIDISILLQVLVYRSGSPAAAVAALLKKDDHNS